MEYRSQEIIQNLQDAGCDQKTVEYFVEAGKTGDAQIQLKILEKHRKGLLEQLHKNEKKIDCLDYLVFQMKKEAEKQA